MASDRELLVPTVPAFLKAYVYTITARTTQLLHTRRSDLGRYAKEQAEAWLLAGATPQDVLWSLKYYWPSGPILYFQNTETARKELALLGLRECVLCGTWRVRFHRKYKFCKACASDLEFVGADMAAKEAELAADRGIKVPKRRKRKAA